jgi:hypothetical protein
MRNNINAMVVLNDTKYRFILVIFKIGLQLGSNKSFSQLDEINELAHNLIFVFQFVPDNVLD